VVLVVVMVVLLLVVVWRQREEEPAFSKWVLSTFFPQPNPKYTASHRHHRHCRQGTLRGPSTRGPGLPSPAVLGTCREQSRRSE